jgi:hypothetical protein
MFDSTTKVKAIAEDSREMLVPRNSPDKSRHDKMVALVQTMLDLHKRLQSAKTPDEKTALQRQITATDNHIDHLVYELYNLTPQEINIIEDSTK